MKRITLKARHYGSPAALEVALRESIRFMGLEDPEEAVVQCQVCHGWFTMDHSEIRADDPPRRHGRFWKIKACQECLPECGSLE